MQNTTHTVCLINSGCLSCTSCRHAQHVAAVQQFKLAAAAFTRCPDALMPHLHNPQACAAYEAAAAVRPNASAALYNWGVALSDLARVLKAAASTAAQHQHQLQQQQQQQAPSVTPSKGTTGGGAAAQQPSVHGKAAGHGQGAGPGAAGATSRGSDGKGPDAGATGEKALGSYVAAARRCLALASEKYREALTYQPCNPQVRLSTLLAG